jgi:uncharacterized protein
VARGWRRYAEWRLPVWIYAVAVLALPALAGISALIVGRPGAGLLEMWRNVGPFTAIFVFVSIAGQLASSPLLEEYGWRGYLQPSLQERHRALPSALVVGLLWGTHHVPFGDRLRSPSVANLPVRQTIFGAVGPSILAAWLLNEGSGSMVGVMFLHASLNVAIQMIAPGGPLFDVLVFLFATGVVAVVGSIQLARRPRFTLAVEEGSRSPDASRVAPPR